MTEHVDDKRRERKRGRLFRLSLRAFFVLLTSGCVLLGAFVSRVSRQRQAVAKLREEKILVWYTHEDAFTSKDDIVHPAPQWLIDRLGIDYFDHPDRLTIIDDATTSIDDAAPLTGIIELDISETQVTDISAVRNMRNLRFLNADFAPVKSIEPLRSLRRLETADLEETAIASIDPLESLSLSGKSIQDLRPLAKLNSLLNLQLSDMSVRDLTPLKNLPLDRLLIENLPIEDVTAVAKIKPAILVIEHAPLADLTPLDGALFLDVVHLPHTNVSDVKPLIGHRPLDLNVSHTKITDLHDIAKMTTLSRLYLEGTSIDDLSPLKKCINLEYLRIGGTNIRDIDVLRSLPKLIAVDIGDLPIPDDQLDAVRRSLPQCEITRNSQQPHPYFRDW